MNDYEVTVKGHINSRRFSGIEGISLELMPSGDTRVLCTGFDQSSLHGIIARIRDLGLVLKEVRVRGDVLE